MMVKHKGGEYEGGNVGSHSEANNVELSVTPNSCNREVRESMLAHVSLPYTLR